MSVAAFISSQRAEHGVPHATACRALGVSPSWFYQWQERPPSPRQRRRAELDEAVRRVFDASGATYGSPRITAELQAMGRRVGENTVAASMAAQQLVARPKRRRRSLTRADKTARRAPDLVGRDFSAAEPNLKWCGDLTEIPTGEGKLYLAAVEDLFSRRLLGFAMSDRHDAELAVASLRMAAAVRGGTVAGVIFHTDQGSEGGFKRSSQHLIWRCWDGTSAGLGDAEDGQGADAVAGASADLVAGAASPVLGADRGRTVERGGR